MIDLPEFAAALPRQGALLGLDPGEKRIGVAVSDTGRMIASSLGTVTRTKFAADAEAILAFYDQRRCVGLVIGLPLNMDGTPGPRTARARKFGNRLKARYNLPVDMVDERLTTVLARNALTEAGVSGRRQKPQLDRQAAALILQAFLNDSREAGA